MIKKRNELKNKWILHAFPTYNSDVVRYLYFPYKSKTQYVFGNRLKGFFFLQFVGLEIKYIEIIYCAYWYSVRQFISSFII